MASSHSQQVCGAGVAAELPRGWLPRAPNPQTGLCPERAKDPEGAAPCLRRPENRGQTAQSPECSDVFKDRLLVSVLMRARPALGWGSFLEAADWGQDTQAMQPEVTARGRHRETVSQHQTCRPGSRSHAPVWLGSRETCGACTGQWGRARAPGSPQFP